MNHSFYSKSAGISFIVILCISLYYFASVFGQVQFPMQADAAPVAGIGQLAFVTLVLLIVAEVTFHIVLTIGAGRAAAAAKPDRVVECKAMRNAYYVLAVGALATFAALLFNASTFLVGHFLLLFFVLAELTKFASQVLYYQRTR